MRRENLLEQAVERPHDVVVIGGGATGLGIALDAASRGFRTLLLEAHDFGKGTSSRSTKLIHGGLRYLRQGNTRLIREASVERGLLLRLAPHLVRPLQFYLPVSRLGERIEYRLGLELYEWLAGHLRIGPVQKVRARDAARLFPTLKAEHRRGGYFYWDAQFDDARYLVHLARTAVRYGAVILNYAPVVELHRGVDGRIETVVFEDLETKKRYAVKARVVINATGPFVDNIRRMVNPSASSLILPSRGSHLVLDAAVWPARQALIVPRTRDGRVLFLIPWHGRVLAGTTDVPVTGVELEPAPSTDEVGFIIETLTDYLNVELTPQQILASFAGIRPLVSPRAAPGAHSTADVSRDHVVLVSRTGLVTITGGKWTTYRWMAEDCLNRVMARGMLDYRPCRTRAVRLDGYVPAHPAENMITWDGLYAAMKADLVRKEPQLGELIAPGAPLRRVDVFWAVTEEMARTVEDVLARRTRLLFLDSRLALTLARPVAEYMATLLQRPIEWIDQQWGAVNELVQRTMRPIDEYFRSRTGASSTGAM